MLLLICKMELFLDLSMLDGFCYVVLFLSLSFFVFFSTGLNIAQAEGLTQ